MRTFIDNDGAFLQRRVTWNLADWPRIRDLEESLVWIRTRLAVPKEGDRAPQSGIPFGSASALGLAQPR